MITWVLYRRISPVASVSFPPPHTHPTVIFCHYMFRGQVSFVRWEDIPWDNLAFPTTSWALWHHRQRVQGTKSVSSVRPPVQSLFGNEHCTGVGRGSEEPTGHEGDFLSPETVFTAPGDDHTLFWCPHRGLHRKGDWKLSTDS